jgi:hypothetical protein
MPVVQVLEQVVQVVGVKVQLEQMVLDTQVEMVVLVPYLHLVGIVITMLAVVVVMDIH